ncbi:DUF2637 domain-containing protein [Streptomyces solincola]|nr:DUF2637 domain-containing protein [Streptomyces solincola]
MYDDRYGRMREWAGGPDDGAFPPGGGDRVVEGRLVHDGRGVPGPRSGPDVGVLDLEWDPSDELASLLDAARPPAAEELAADWAEESDEGREARDRLGAITAELPPLRRARADHRRRRARSRSWSWVRTVSVCIAAVVAALVAMVSVFSGVIAYDPLHGVAADRTGAGVAGWWPVLVYGPWAVASLSILRAALHQRRALHSWLVVLLFSTTGMLLGVAHEAHTIVDAAVAALPAAASLACFQQLVRLITLTRPPRQAHPRHRVLAGRRPSAAGQSPGPAGRR